MVIILLFLTDTTTVSYQAQTIIYDFTDSTIILIDSARITYGQLNLYADTCYYHYDRSLLVSLPKSTIIQDGDTLSGAVCRYSLETKIGMIENGRANVEKGYLYGDEIWLVGEHQFNIVNGRYTTCDHDPPHYYFYAPRMKVYLDDIAIGEPVILMVRFVPFLAAPFWFVPISKKRKSGLLPFRAGRSSDEGEYIKDFSYYLVINDYADITFTTDIMRKKGIRPEINLIYKYRPYSEGNWYSNYIKEIETKRVRYKINGYNRTDRFLFRSKLLARVDYQSDETYNKEYAEERPLLLQREFHSFLTLSRDILSTKNTLTLERRIDYDDTTTTDHIPRYDITFPTFNLINITSTPTFFYLRERTEVRTNGVYNLRGGLATNFPISFINYSPSVNLDFAGYEKDSLGNPYPHRFGYSTIHNLSTTLFRLFPLELFGLSGFLHRVVPTVGYTYSPEIKDLPVHPIGGVASYQRTSSVTFGLSNNFETKFHDRKIPVFNSNLGINYNLITDSLSNGTIRFSSHPNRNIDLRANFTINPYTKDVSREFSEGIKIKTRFFDLDLNHTYSSLSHQVWASIHPAKFLGIDLTGSARYDLNQREIVEYSINLIKDLHCWEFLFNFDALGRDWRYDFKVRIKEIPEIEIGKGILGIFPE